MELQLLVGTRGRPHLQNGGDCELARVLKRQLRRLCERCNLTEQVGALADLRRPPLLRCLRLSRSPRRLCRCTLLSEDAQYRTLGGIQVNGVPWIVLQPCKALAAAECRKIFGSPNEGVDVMPAVALSLAYEPTARGIAFAGCRRSSCAP